MKDRDREVLRELAKMVGYSQPERFERKIDQWEEVIAAIAGRDMRKVVELGSGVSPKIVFALSGVGFCGELTVVDWDEKALAAQRIVAGSLGVGFGMKTYCQDLFNFSLTGYELVAANHLIDDLIADRFSKKRGIDYGKVFADPWAQKDFWEEVACDVAVGDSVVSDLSEKLFGVDSGTVVVVNHYQANIDERFDIRTRDEVCEDLFGRLRVMMTKKGFRDMGIGDKGWAVLRK